MSTSQSQSSSPIKTKKTKILWGENRKNLQINVQGNKMNDNKFNNPIVFNDIEQAIDWKKKAPLFVRVYDKDTNSKVTTIQFPLNGGVHQCCFHVVPKRGSAEDVRRCRLVNKLVGVDMYFYRCVDPEGITAKSIQWYHENENIPREFMFGRQFFCWKHMNLLFGVRPRLKVLEDGTIDNTTTKKIGLFAISNLRKSTIVAAFSNSNYTSLNNEKKVSTETDLIFFRDLGNYCNYVPNENPSINCKLININIVKNNANNNNNVTYIPLDSNDTYEDHEDYFKKNTYDALQLTVDIWASKGNKIELNYLKNKKLATSSINYKLTYQKSKKNIGIGKYKEKNIFELQQKDIIIDESINKNKIAIQNELSSADNKLNKNEKKYIEKNLEKFVFIAFCPKTLKELTKNIDCEPPENEPNTEIIFMLKHAAVEQTKTRSVALKQKNNIQVSKIQLIGKLNIIYNFLNDCINNFEYFYAMSPREYNYLLYILNNLKTNPQINKIISSKYYNENKKKIYLVELNRATTYYRHCYNYYSTEDFNYYLKFMLSYKTLLSVFENIVNNKYAVKDYNEEYFNYVNVNNFIENIKKKNNNIIEKINNLRTTNQTEYTDEEKKIIIDEINETPDFYIAYAVDQQYRQENSIGPNYLYTETNLSIVQPKEESTGRAQSTVWTSSKPSNKNIIIENNIINVFRNGGNTCWLDSALIFLFASDSVLNFEINNELTNLIKETKAYINSSDFLLKSKYASQIGWNNTFFEKEINGQTFTNYNNKQENDPSEFLNFILTPNFSLFNEIFDQDTNHKLGDSTVETYSNYPFGKLLKFSDTYLEAFKEILKTYKDETTNKIYKNAKIERKFIYSDTFETLIFANSGMNNDSWNNEINKNYRNSRDRFFFPKIIEIETVLEPDYNTAGDPINFTLASVIVNPGGGHYVCFFRYANSETYYLYNDLGPSITSFTYDNMKNYCNEPNNFATLFKYIKTNKFISLQGKQQIILTERIKKIASNAVAPVVAPAPAATKATPKPKPKTTTQATTKSVQQTDSINPTKLENIKNSNFNKNFPTMDQIVTMEENLFELTNNEKQSLPDLYSNDGYLKLVKTNKYLKVFYIKYLIKPTEILNNKNNLKQFYNDMDEYVEEMYKIKKTTQGFMYDSRSLLYRFGIELKQNLTVNLTPLLVKYITERFLITNKPETETEKTILLNKYDVALGFWNKADFDKYVKQIYNPVKELVGRYFDRIINISGTTKKYAIKIDRKLRDNNLNNLTGIQDFIAKKTKPEA